MARIFWMRLYLAVLLGYSIIGLTACAHRVSIAAPAAPTIPGTNDNGDINITKSINITQIYNADSYKKDIANYTIAVNTSLTDSTRLAKAKQARNNIIWGEMGAIESVYTIYHTRLFSDKNLLSVGSDTMTLGLSAASTIATHAPTKTILSALGTAFAGIGLSIDKNSFGQQSFQILGVAMQTRRDKVRAVIASNLASCDVNSYPLLQAQRDLIQYFGSGTLDSALQELQEEAGAASSSAASGTSPATPSTTSSLPVTACSSATTATPAFNPPAGSSPNAQSVAISSATAGATIYYTTDGSVPTTSSTRYSAPIQVSSTETIQAIATASGSPTSAVASAAYTIAPAGGPPAATPTFNPPAGSFPNAQSVAISSATAGATIYYTTNGSVPTTSSTRYSAPIQVSSTETIQAIATASGFATSAVASAAYTIAPAAAGATTATPAFNPPAGSFPNAQSVAISSATAGATIYYTTNGSVPTTSSTRYSAPIQVSSTETIQAIATASGFADSAVASAAYTIAPAGGPPAATPTFNPPAGSFPNAQSVAISSATAGATIYYTTNGSVPTTSSTRYSAPIQVSSTETIQAIATASGFADSAVAAAAYTIGTAPILGHAALTAH